MNLSTIFNFSGMATTPGLYSIEEAAKMCYDAKLTMVGSDIKILLLFAIIFRAISVTAIYMDNRKMLVRYLIVYAPIVEIMFWVGLLVRIILSG